MGRTPRLIDNSKNISHLQQKNSEVRINCNVKMYYLLFLLFDPKDQFKLCTPFDGSAPADQANFLGNIVAILQYAVQYDWNGSINISDVCEIMENESLGSPLDRLSELNEL